MAFENLRPHEAFILELIEEGRTLSQVVDVLDSRHGVRTTPGTISRFVTSLKPVRRKPPAKEAQPSLFTHPVPPSAPEPASTDPGPDVRAILTEILASVDGGRDEGREVMELLAGKISGLSGDLVELEKGLEPLHRVGGQAEGHAADLARAIAGLRAELTEKLDAVVLRQAEMAAAATQTVTPQALAQIWTRAFVVAFLAWVIVIGGLLLAARLLAH